MTQNGRLKKRITDGRLISVVDDDESVRQATANLLRSAGFKVEIFPSAEKFLDSSSSLDTACLILDVQMPGLSGPDLQRRLAINSRRIPIIFITAHADARIQAEVMRAGAVDMLAKPFTDEAFFRAVEAGLEAGTAVRTPLLEAPPDLAMPAASLRFTDAGRGGHISKESLNCCSRFMDL